MKCAVLVQTCDKYERFWDGFFNFFEKQWDFKIDCPIYFCNEFKNINLPTWAKQIKTGNGTFVQNLHKALDLIPEDEIFFLLEDYWPIASMSNELFSELHSHFVENKLDAFQVGPYTPYYKLEKLNKKIKEQSIWKITCDSDWLFNFQARFWKKQTLKNCLREPDIPEEKVSSAITVEMSSNELAQKNKIEVHFYHYFWYPISGVATRGETTQIGKDMQNIVNIDNLARSLTD